MSAAVKGHVNLIDRIGKTGLMRESRFLSYRVKILDVRSSHGAPSGWEYQVSPVLGEGVAWVFADRLMDIR